jgi:hypothetical protein
MTGMLRHHLSLNESLWICGGIRTQGTLYPRIETAALRERGAEVFLFNGPKDAKGLAELQHRLQHSDVHVVLIWLRPNDVKSLYPVLRERKNFSIVLDDWWICPPWFMREAEYVIFRMFNGIAVRLGLAPFITSAPPLLVKPEPLSPYAITAALLRLPALAAWPFVDACKWLRRHNDVIRPERLLYLPLSVAPEALPLKGEKVEYDFAMTGSTVGVWLMRDAYASFRHTFANLYYDRQRLLNLITSFDGKPYKVYDWRRQPVGRPPQSWDDYTRISRQSRYAIATGGLHNAGLPKHLEYACLGVPMIGPKTLFEFPWLDECIIEANAMSLDSRKIKPLLDEALERYPVLRANCLKWREQLFKLHDIHRLLDMLQAQADGQPIPPEYLRAGVDKLARASKV